MRISVVISIFIVMDGTWKHPSFDYSLNDEFKKGENNNFREATPPPPEGRGFYLRGLELDRVGDAPCHS